MNRSTKIKKKVGTSTSSNLNKNSNPNVKISYKVKNGKSTMTSKNSNLKSNGNANININKSVPMKSNIMGLNESSNNFVSLPPEMKITFEKMISQLDLIGKTMKIFDQRIQNLEGHITTISNRYKKNFVQKQPPQMGDYQYLMENSGSNYLPNNSMRNNNEDYQKYTNLNNMDYYTAEIYNTGSTFKDAMNINEENKKNMFKTEIDINKINNETQQIKNENEIINSNGNVQYMGQLHEEYGYNNLGENDQEPQNQQEGNNEQYEEEQGEEYIEQNNEQQGEEYEEMQGQEEEQYDNEEQYEEQYEEGNYGEEEQIEQMEEYNEEQENGEEEIQYDDNEEQNNGQENNNNEQETPK